MADYDPLAIDRGSAGQRAMTRSLEQAAIARLRDQIIAQPGVDLTHNEATSQAIGELQTKGKLR